MMTRDNISYIKCRNLQEAEMFAEYLDTVKKQPVVLRQCAGYGMTYAVAFDSDDREAPYTLHLTNIISDTNNEIIYVPISSNEFGFAYMTNKYECYNN